MGGDGVVQHNVITGVLEPGRITAGQAVIGYFIGSERFGAALPEQHKLVVPDTAEVVGIRDGHGFVLAGGALHAEPAGGLFALLAPHDAV